MIGGWALTAPLGPLESTLVELGDGQLFFPVALLLAVVLGAAHACAPGHGKALAAGYLLGGGGGGRDALVLGLVVAGMHTASVGILGVAWWLLVDAAPFPSGVTAWLQLLAALLVLAVGIALLRRHLAVSRAVRIPAHAHTHAHAGHQDGDRAERHHHQLPVGQPLLTRRGLVLLGTSGGLLPSPSAFLVLVSGLLTGQALVAGLLVAAFGAGMAGTLAGVGWLTVRGRDVLLTRTAARPRLRALTARLPLAAAAAVLLGGCVLSVAAAVRLLAL